MGRITTSFRLKLDEAVSRIRTELLSLIIDEKVRKGAEKIIKSWYSEANALSNFSQPYIFGTLTLFSIFSLQSQIAELEEKLKELNDKLLKIEEKVNMV